MTRDTWEGAILGTVLGSLVVPGVLWLINRISRWWRDSRPARKLLGGIADNAEQCKIFVRDFLIEADTKLISVEPRVGIGVVPNVHHLWPDVEGRAVGDLLNVFGQVGKTRGIEIVRMSEDAGEWNCHVIVLGAQANKSYDFYKHLRNVAFRMDGEQIYENATGNIVTREDGFGYGIILKSLNPFKTTSLPGVGLLIGGFGVLGTAAAAHYFREHYKSLGKEFGARCFGIVVRAPITAGEQAVERLSIWDRTFGSKRAMQDRVPAGGAFAPLPLPLNGDVGAHSHASWPHWDQPARP